MIVECGFLSNAKEEALLQDETYRQNIAQAVLRWHKRLLLLEPQDVDTIDQ